MIKLKKSLAVILSLTLTFGAGTPVFAAGETAAVQAEAVSTEAPATTPAAVKKPPKTGFYKRQMERPTTTRTAKKSPINMESRSRENITASVRLVLLPKCLKQRDLQVSVLINAAEA